MLDRLTIQRLRAWAGDRPVLLALSGGGDSVALLHLLVAELGAARIRAAVVDHALREGSGSDAARARSFAEALGVHAIVLTLAWTEGANRAQQAARQARYRALCQHARAEGIHAIVAGHTADDQAETVFMRAANGSAWRGLAGIAPFAFAPVWPEGRGIALARPLLGSRREALRAFLDDRRADWIEDPANANPMFERVRVRGRLRQLEGAGFDPMRLVRLAQRLRQRVDELDCAAGDLISRAVRLGLVTNVSHAAWDAPGDVRRRALSVLIAAVSGGAREPPWSEMEAWEQRIMHRSHRGATYGGVEFMPAQSGVEMLREAGAVLGRAGGMPPLPPLPLVAGVEVIWDGRLAICALDSGWSVVPARNRERAAFESGLVRQSYSDVEERVRRRPLVTERIAHAFAPDINRAKP